MRSLGALSASIGLLVVAPVVVVTVFGGGAQAAGVGGLGAGLKPGTVPAQFVDLVLQAGSMCPAAPPSIIAAQIEQESNWNPDAVSPAGAEGISQFMPGTWPNWSLPGQSPFDPAAAIPAQGRYDCAIAAQLQPGQQAGLFGSLDLTSLMLAGYNAGPAAVIAAKGIPNNGQTPDYVAKIMARAAHFADTTGVPVPGSFAAKEIVAAQSQLGQPYSWAGGSYTGPTLGVCGPGAAQNDCHIVGWDCSGLVMYAAYQASAGTIRLPHSAELQTRGGTAVARTAIAPGDLISFTNPGESTAHHIGIYIGNNQMIDAPQSGELVQVESLTSSYYQAQQWRAVRYG